MTAIIEKDGKYLITRRAQTKKRFPGKWVVPGGRLETTDYANGPKDNGNYWCNVLEQTLRREIREEVGLEVADIQYVTSLATIHEDGNPSLVISCLATYASGEVVLQEGETDAYEWVSAEEARDKELIGSIYDEIVMADAYRKEKRP